jgi:hypothetical protein
VAENSAPINISIADDDGMGDADINDGK